MSDGDEMMRLCCCCSVRISVPGVDRGVWTAFGCPAAFPVPTRSRDEASDGAWPCPGVALVMAVGPRVHSRMGGLEADAISRRDGLR